MNTDHSEPETSHSNYLLSLIGAGGSLVLFLFIMFLAYLPNRPAPVDQVLVEERLNTLREVRSKDIQAAGSYEWINRQDGVVRIPVERAMELATQRMARGEPAFPGAGAAVEAPAN